MKKKRYLFIGGLLCIIAIILASILIMHPFFHTRVYDNSDYASSTETIDASFNEIKISLASQGLKVNYTDDTKVKVDYYEVTDHDYTVTLSQNVLVIDEIHHRDSYYSHRYQADNKYTEISLPKNMVSQYDIALQIGSLNLLSDEKEDIASLKIYQTCGNIDIQGLNVTSEANIEVITGDVHIESCTFSDFELSVVTGNVSFLNSEITTKLNLKTITGNINLSSCNINSCKFDITTGNIALDELISPSIDIDLITGNAHGTVKGEQSKYNIAISITLGNSSLSNQEVESDQYLNARIVTGDLNISFIK